MPQDIGKNSADFIFVKFIVKNTGVLDCSDFMVKCRVQKMR